MLTMIAKILVGSAVGLLVLVAVGFAFAADLVSSPPQPRPVRRVRSRMNPNIENIAFEEIRR